MRSVPYHKPGTLKEAFDLKKRIPGSFYVSGGTDLMVRMKQGDVRPAALISLRSVKELQGVRVTNRSVRIGGGTTVADIIANPELSAACPVLGQAARRLGSAQIRNVATVGGNLCNGSPCADTATPLLVLEAEVEVRGPRGKRKIPLDRFFDGPKSVALNKDEVLTAVAFKPPGPDAAAVFLKKGRVQLDLAVASLSVLVERKGGKCTRARVAAGSVAPTPMRLRKVEQLLEGSDLAPEVVARAGELASRTVAPITDVRSTEAYRRHIIGVYLKRALDRLAGGVRK